MVRVDGLRYYEMKNVGAGFADGEVIIFLDSDVILESGWLAALLGEVTREGIGVACGSTYLATSSFVERAFAAFWIFPPRIANNGTVFTPRFFANNVAFRREVVAAFPFPVLPQYRGQCVELSSALRSRGIAIRLVQHARVEHPPPNGLAHFFARAVAEGHDRITQDRRRGENLVGAAMHAGSVVVYHLIHTQWLTLQRRRAVNLGLPGTIGALAIAACYWLLALGGIVATMVNARWVRKNIIRITD